MKECCLFICYNVIRTETTVLSYLTVDLFWTSLTCDVWIFQGFVILKEINVDQIPRKNKCCLIFFWITSCTKFPSLLSSLITVKETLFPGVSSNLRSLYTVMSSRCSYHAAPACICGHAFVKAYWRARVHACKHRTCLQRAVSHVSLWWINKEASPFYWRHIQACSPGIDGKIESILKGLSNMTHGSSSVFSPSCPSFYSPPLPSAPPWFILDSGLCELL